MLFDEMTYLILLARYKEMASGGGGGRGGDVPYDVKFISRSMTQQRSMPSI